MLSSYYVNIWITGTDADKSTIIKEKHETLQPTINKFYQMLHGTLNESTNLSNSLHSFLSNLIPTSIDNFQECCNGISVENTANETKSSNGAITPVLDKDRKHRKRKADYIQESVTYEVTTVVLPLPAALERRRKPGETGSSAPLLNYIFDTYTNTHQHRNDR